MMLNACINLCSVAFDYKEMFCEGDTVYSNINNSSNNVSL